MSKETTQSCLQSALETSKVLQLDIWDIIRHPESLTKTGKAQMGHRISHIIQFIEEAMAIEGEKK